MLRRSVVLLLGVAAASIFLTRSVGAQAAGPSPLVGTWKLNVARSTYSPGPAPQANHYDLRQYAPLEGGWMRFISTSVNAMGEPTFTITVFRVDGQQYPVEGERNAVHNLATLTALMTTGRPTNVARSYRRIDSRTIESTTYTDGVPAVTIRTIAPDGRSYTDAVGGTDPQGRAINNVLVFERVR